MQTCSKIRFACFFCSRPVQIAPACADKLPRTCRARVFVRDRTIVHFRDLLSIHQCSTLIACACVPTFQSALMTLACHLISRTCQSEPRRSVKEVTKRCTRRLTSVWFDPYRQTNITIHTTITHHECLGGGRCNAKAELHERIVCVRFHPHCVFKCLCIKCMFVSVRRQSHQNAVHCAAPQRRWPLCD